MNKKNTVPLLILLLASILMIISQYPIIENIWQFSFDDGTYSHAYLVPFLCAYLYWQINYEGKLAFNQSINIKALVAICIITFFLVIFTIAQFTTGYRVFIVFFYTSLIALIFKPSLKVIFPAIFLIFIIPIWGILTSPLQNLSTAAVTSIMSLSGIPIYVEGNIITIPEGVFEIAGGCSGLRYLLVSLSVSSLFIFLYIKNIKHALIFIAIATMGALLTNWIRITALILIGHYTNMESELMTDHNTFGWYLYIPFMFLLFSFGQRFFVNADSQIQAKYTKTSIYFPNLILAASILIFSSPLFLTHILSAPSSNQATKCLENFDELPLPNIVSKHTSCTIKQDNKYIITYTFTGENLGQSVDYFENKFYPDNYPIQSETTNSEWHTLSVNYNKTTFLIRYQFQSGQSSTTNLSSLKKLKILNAVHGIRESKLIWTITPATP